MIEIVRSPHINGKENGILLLGYLNRDLAGTALACIVGTVLELESIHTNPNRRRNGVASELLSEVRSWGRNMGGVTLTGELIIRKDTIKIEEVIAWYKKRGINVSGNVLSGKL